MDTVREQFEKEAAALVQIIREMISNGQYFEAGQLLEQYAQLCPYDPQIEELRKSISVPAGAVKPQLPSFLSDIESIFILQALSSTRKGLPASVYGKLTLMEERLGYCGTILTTLHDINMRKTEVWLKTFTGNQKMLSPGIKILNVFEYFQMSYADGLENKAVYNKAGNDGLQYTKESDTIYAAYDGDTLIRRDDYSGYGGSLRMERYYKNEKIEKDIYYDDWGYLNNIVEYDPDNPDFCSVKYYTTDGRLCIEIPRRNIKKHRSTDKMIICNADGTIMTNQGNEAMLIALYLSKLAENNKFNLIVFEDVTKTISTAYMNRTDINGALIVPIHTTFLEDAYDFKSEVRYAYSYLCKNTSKFDSIVFLTKEACNDFTKLYKGDYKPYVIAHPYYLKIQKVSFEERDTMKAVIIARLSPEKQIDTAIEIFSLVAESLPQAQLEIYGGGDADADETDVIIKRIKDLGMENNIRLMGYTNDAIAIYRKATAFIMTSRYEGYGLTLMESICNGCPAFSFDIKYGPSGIIKDGQTGFLFPRGDIKAFAAKLIEFFKDRNMQRAMSENCYNDAARFSTDIFLDNWLCMTKELRS